MSWLLLISSMAQSENTWLSSQSVLLFLFSKNVLNCENKIMKKIPSNIFTPITKENLRISDLRGLCAVLGGEMTLRRMVDELQKQYPHKCPKCDGRGFNVARINTYPSGLRDSGWVDQYENFDIKCDICNGQGYTSEKLIAKPVQVEYVKE
jgi:hypothetical protein